MRAALLGRAVEGNAATLTGYTVLAQTGAHLPALCPQGGAVAEGLVLPDLSDEEIARLDSYEIPFDYTPHTREVTTPSAVVSARVYLPEASVDVSGTPWSLAAWDAAHGDLSREMAREIGATRPPMTGKELQQAWHMIGVRAAARLRARAITVPTTVRRAPEPGDFQISDKQPPAGAFFRYHTFNVTHRTFQDAMSPPLEREGAVTCDAAIILPYDPVSDCVLLVEQIRTGPLLRDDPNPWVLEPVAGMIDGGETPQEAALRETQEEAGLTDVALRLMYRCYSSPGVTADYHHCYLGLAKLPEPTVYTGGLAAENEDLRLHVLPFAQAFALIESGEANVGPLISMLLWLAHHRDGLRSTA